MPTTDGPPEKTGKLSLFYKRHEMTITWAEVVIIFLALIRTITAYYQLKTAPAISFRQGRWSRSSRDHW